MTSTTPTRIELHVDRCGSTQDLARLHADSTAERGIVVVTSDEQIAGRGREGRRWVMPPGGRALACSIALRGPIDAERLDGLPARIAGAVADVLADVSGAARSSLEVRAPNDIYIAGSKVGGVLVDARTRGSDVELLVVGVGANLTGSPFIADGTQAVSLEAAGAEAGPLVRMDAMQIARRICERVEALVRAAPAT